MPTQPPVRPTRTLTNEGEALQVLRLNGVDDQLSLTGTENITNEFVNGFTLTGIINAEEIAGYRHIFSKQVPPHASFTDRSFGLYYDANQLKFIIEIFDINGTVISPQITNSTPLVGTDMFFSVAYNPATGDLSSYVKGVYNIRPVGFVTINPSLVPVTIGSVSGNTTYRLRGQFKHFSIWKRVLTQAEMSTLARVGNNKQAGEVRASGASGYTSPACLFYSTLQHTSSTPPVNLALTEYATTLTQAVPVVGATQKRVVLINGKFRLTNNATPVISSTFILPADGLRAWFKADTDANFILNDNGSVNRWLDSSANQNDAVASNSQIYVQGNIIRGKRAVRINTTTTLGLSTLNNIGIQSAESSTIFAVVQIPNSVSKALFAYGISSNAQLYEMLCYGNRFVVSSYSTDYNSIITVGANGGNYVLAFHKNRDARTLGFYQDGVLINTHTSSSFDSTANTPFRIGTGLIGFYNIGGMDMAEIIIYNRLLTADENTIVTNYLMAKYPLPMVDELSA